MKTFIFGAGASFHAGYPLASQLWHSLENWVRATFPDDHDFRCAVDTMQAEFDLSRPFELVLTDLDQRLALLLKERPTTRGGIEEKVMLAVLWSRLQAMIPLYFNSLRSQQAEVYRAFVEDVLVRGDAVITFNYDLALDREMKRSGKWSIGNGYGFEIDTAAFGDSACTLFKLHGSTNWRGEHFQGMHGFFQVNSTSLSLGQRPIIDRSEFRYLGYADGSDPKSHDGQTRTESLIMPVAYKKFFVETSLGREWESFWDSLWSQAGEALRASNEIHLIGYSMPEYDDRARKLLATKISKHATVKVCCHGATAGVVESLKQLRTSDGFDVEPACAPTFEGWVSGMTNA